MDVNSLEKLNKFKRTLTKSEIFISDAIEEAFNNLDDPILLTMALKDRESFLDTKITTVSKVTKFLEKTGFL